MWCVSSHRHDFKNSTLTIIITTNLDEKFPKEIIRFHWIMDLRYILITMNSGWMKWVKLANHLVYFLYDWSQSVEIVHLVAIYQCLILISRPFLIMYIYYFFGLFHFIRYNFSLEKFWFVYFVVCGIIFVFSVYKDIGTVTMR